MHEVPQASLTEQECPSARVLLHALQAALMEAHELDMDLQLLRRRILHSLVDGLDPRGLGALQLSPAGTMLDEALARLIQPS